MKGFEALKITQHRISNMLIELDGDKDTAETYVLSYTNYNDAEGVEQESLVGGRHQIELEKRDGEWKISKRASIFDWNQNQKASAVWAAEFNQKFASKRDKSDNSYNYITK